MLLLSMSYTMPTLGLVVATWHKETSLLTRKIYLHLKYLATIKDFFGHTHNNLLKR